MDTKVSKNLDIKHKFLVKSLNFTNYEITGQNFRVKPVFSKKITKIDDTKFEVSLKCEILNTDENKFPFDLTAIISLITIFGDGTIPVIDDLDYYLNVTCLQLLFPYLRSVVTNLTTTGMVNPLVLPVIDVNNFSEMLKKDEKGGD